MKHVMVLGVFITLMLSSELQAERQCFLMREKGNVILQDGYCEVGSAPCSTFKIPLSVMGFDAGYLQDETHPEFPFEEGYVDWLERWKQPHNPKTWLQNSCLWFSQYITRRLGQDQLEAYLAKFNYGNQDVSGTPGKNNQLTDSWISSSLQISPHEQAVFLQSLLDNQLSATQYAQEMTKANLFLEELPGGWNLYGKTGSGCQFDENGVKDESRQLGWFIGWIEKDDRKLVFVKRVLDDEKQETFASLRAKADARVRLVEWIGSL